MGKVEITADKKQAGFTLVELAVVMIIIGLLIGGVLKGQELIANAQIASTVSQIKGVDAAVSTFGDTYNAFPGDMGAATTRIANCSSPCADGDGDSALDNAPNVAAANAAEGEQFWIHMNLADLITGVDMSGDGLFGGGIPSAPVGGGLVAGFTASGAVAGTDGGRGGHYIVLRSDPGAVGTGSTLTPNQAARIDNKMDDGSPNGGTVLAIGGTPGTAACVDAAGVGGIYNENLQGLLCDVAIRIQQ